MAAAVLSVDRRAGRIQLLGVDGSWRELRLPNDDGRLALSREELSPDGTRLAALLDDGIELWHLPTGERTTLPLPVGYEPWDDSWVDWVDDDALLLDDLTGGWRGDTIAGTSFESNGFAVQIADRLDLSPRYLLPVRDHEANYSNWALRTVAILEDGAVLLWIGVPSRSAEVDGWRLVRWVPTTDRLEVVTTSESDPTWPLTFAGDLLG